MARIFDRFSQTQELGISNYWKYYIGQVDANAGFLKLKNANVKWFLYKWCLCALRWKEAMLNNFAPKVILEATNEKTLEVIEMKDLLKHSHKKTV